MDIIIGMIFAYLLGSVSSAILVCRFMNLTDPRTAGSLNPGATNVLRVGGKKAAALTLIGDMLKGFVPVALAQAWGMPVESLVMIAFTAFIGHLYPIFFAFRGGKGVATFLGVLLGLNGWVGAGVIAVWLSMTGLFHISSLSALVASLIAPVLVWWLESSVLAVLVTALMTSLLFWRHRTNIRDLLGGAEESIRGPSTEK